MPDKHLHQWVICGPVSTRRRAGVLSRCKECGRERFRGRADGKHVEQILEGGRWVDARD